MIFWYFNSCNHLFMFHFYILILCIYALLDFAVCIHVNLCITSLGMATSQQRMFRLTRGDWNEKAWKLNMRKCWRKKRRKLKAMAFAGRCDSWNVKKSCERGSGVSRPLEIMRTRQQPIAMAFAAAVTPGTWRSPS